MQRAPAPIPGDEQGAPIAISLIPTVRWRSTHPSTILSITPISLDPLFRYHTISDKNERKGACRYYWIILAFNLLPSTNSEVQERRHVDM